jgi:hypothetical protein
MQVLGVREQEVQDSHKISVSLLQKSAVARTSEPLIKAAYIEGSEPYELLLDRAGEYRLIDNSIGKRTIIVATNSSSSSSRSKTGSSSSKRSSSSNTNTTGSSSHSSSSSSNTGTSSSSSSITAAAPLVAASAALQQHTERAAPQTLMVTESELQQEADAAWAVSDSADAADLVVEPTPLALLGSDLAGGDWRCDARDMPTRRRFVDYIIRYYGQNWSNICMRAQALGVQFIFSKETACLIEAAHYGRAEGMLAYSAKRVSAIRIKALPASCLYEGSALVTTTLPAVLQQSSPQATIAAGPAVVAAAEASAVEQCGQRCKQQQLQTQTLPIAASESQQ